MKVRSGFVSNSSSSSFIINKSDLDNYQLEMIKDYYSICESMVNQGTKLNFYCLEDRWSIYETDHTIEGYTHMNNFDIGEFFEKIVKVDMSKVSWDW